MTAPETDPGTRILTQEVYLEGDTKRHDDEEEVETGKGGRPVTDMNDQRETLL